MQVVRLDGFLFESADSAELDHRKDLRDAMLQAIVGLQIEITRLVGKRKLGQNKDVADIRGAGDALVANGNLAIGEAMIAAADAKRG